MHPEISHIWVYLAASPLLGLAATLIAYQVAYWLHKKAGFSPLANTVAIAIALIVPFLLLTDISYDRYFAGAQFVHFLLGPATVALAVPLFEQWPRLKANAVPLLAGLVAGCLTAIVSVVAVAALLGASRATLLSLAPKSVTMPIAMGIAEKIGGVPSITVVMVIATGIIGAVIARPLLLRVLRIEEHWIRGFSVGIAAHGIGTARAFQVSEEMGAFSGLAMGLNGLLTSIAVPLLIAVFAR
jgi:predicted murein hydrolase (TIGR00659 family)